MINKLRFSLSVQIIICFIVSSIVLYPATIFVNPAASGGNNGSNWNDAYTSLSDALAAAAPGDHIWVVQGVYKPAVQHDFNGNGADVREVTFSLPSNVKLYGGFTGTEINLNERNWELNQTILSGDIDNNDTNIDGNFIAETVSDITGNNAYHVIYTFNAGTGTELNGFIITGGSADIPVPVDAFDPNRDGGGWYNQLGGAENSGSPYIINTVFSGNFASSEGGAFYSAGTLNGEVTSLIDNCTFTGNQSGATGGAVYLGSFSAGNYQPHIKNSSFINNQALLRGGAIYLVGDHSIIDSCTFTLNKTTAISPDFSTLPGSGGAVNLVASNAKFSNCIFTQNSSTGNPTGAYEGGGGGAVYMSSNEPQTTALGDSRPLFISCGFYNNTTGGNTASWGGAVVHLSDAGRLFPSYVNCVFYQNNSQNHGGAVADFIRVMLAPSGFTPALEPSFTNCTFTNNSAGQLGGAVYNDGYELSGNELLVSRLENSILWNNSAGTDGSEIYNTGLNIISYSLIAGSGGSGGSWNTDLGSDAGNNIDDDPVFINTSDPDGADNIYATSDDGLNIPSSSPAINAGNNAAPGLAGITKDYAGNDRKLYGSVDMGAYEQCSIINPPVNPDIYLLTNWKGKKSWSIVLLNSFNHNIFKSIASEDEHEMQEENNIAAKILPKPFGLFQKFVWDGQAQLIDYGDSAIVVGVVKDINNYNLKFKVYLKLIKPASWETWKQMNRTYFAYSLPALKEAFYSHKNWIYRELAASGYLEGTGNVSGKIMLEHWPANKKTGFQFGKGANGWDKDNGLGGMFSYKGKIKYNGKYYLLNGLGSLNSDAELCVDNCEPMVKENLISSASEDNRKLPQSFMLKQNYPNPFNPVTKIAFSIPSEGTSAIVTLKIYDILGGEVATLINEEKSAGEYTVEFNASGLSSGIYFYKLVYGSYSDTKKLILLK
jgi:predicted outer membrane repeat protein